jgi:hypothetical protein
MTTSIEHQIRLILVTWTCVLLQSVRSSSVPIATSPIVSSITSTIRSTSVDSVVTTSATCIGCDDTSVFCTTQGTVTECLDAAVSESFVTETIYETNVATRTTVVGITVGFTTIYSDVADVATPGTVRYSFNLCYELATDFTRASQVPQQSCPLRSPLRQHRQVPSFTRSHLVPLLHQLFPRLRQEEHPHQRTSQSLEQVQRPISAALQLPLTMGSPLHPPRTVCRQGQKPRWAPPSHWESF